MKIGIYVEHARDERPTGIGLHIRNLLDALAALDRHNEYLLYYPCGPREPSRSFPHTPPQPNFRARPVSFPARWRNDHPTLWWKHYLPLILRRDGVDVFHGPNYYLPRFAGRRSIVTIHDLAFFHMPVQGEAFDAALRKWTRFSLERAARVIALSENTRRDVEALGVHPDRIRVIYGGGHWQPEEKIAYERQTELRDTFRLPAHFILFVGTLQPRKNVPFLLRAFAQLKRQTNLPHGLVLVGQRQSGDDLDQQMAELGITADVIVTGYVQEWQLPLLYKMADAFVLPTLYEGFTLVTLEAMAYGVPVIATDTSSIREGTGDAAILVPVNDDTALANVLEEVLTDQALRNRMIALGKVQSQWFTWEQCARQTLELYTEVHESARGGRQCTLVVSENFPPRVGGSGRWLWELYRRLPRDEYVVAAGADPRAAEFERRHDVRVFRIPLSMQTRGMVSLHGLCGYLRGIARVWKLVRREHVEAIHCGRCLPEGWMALAVHWFTGLPYLLYVHGEEMNTASTSRELTWMARRVLANAKIIIANSHNTRAILSREWNVPPERMRVLHPGVDTRRFVPAARNDVVRGQLGWGDRPVLLTVGRLQKRKGHDQLIAALPAIRAQFPDILYAIVGDGEERASLESLSEKLGVTSHVQFLGEVADEQLVVCYQQCDLFLLPNRQVGRDIEGFGMVLLEAQACGKPVVAGASGGTAETMQPGISGEIVPCNGPDPLAAVIQRLLADRTLLARMGTAGRRWCEEHFDWDKLVRQAREKFAWVSSRCKNTRT